jgi:hypothetical protein
MRRNDVTVTSHERLQKILAIPYPSDFLHALAEIDTESRSAPPYPLGLFRTLASLHDRAEDGGIAEYLRTPEGADFGDALAACDAVGALQAAAYLREVQAHFPDGQVPASERERVGIVDAIRLRKPAADRLDTLGKLDVQFATALAEMVAAVRQFVRNERERIESVMGRLAAAGHAAQRDQDADATARHPEVGDERIGLGDESGVIAAGERFLAAAKARPLPALEEWGDRRVRRFCDRLIALDDDQWLLASERYASDAATVNQAMDYAQYLPYQKLYPAGKFQECVHSPTATIRKPLIARLAALPEEVEAGDGIFPLRRIAREAGLRAVFAVSRHDWLVVTEEGRAALAVLLAPFGGIAAISSSVT